MLKNQIFVYADDSVYNDDTDQSIAPMDPIRDFSPPEIKVDPVPEADQDIYSTAAEQPGGSGGGGFQIAGYNGYLVIVLILVLINFLYNHFNK